MRGAVLWLRRNRVFGCVTLAHMAAVAVRMLVSAFIEVDGTETDIDALWVALVAAVPLIFMFTRESEVEQVAPRSLTARRAVLLAAAYGCAVVVAFSCYPTNLTDFGAIAVLRNILALVGLGLLSLALWSPRWAWVPPVLVAVASMMFSWPLHPSTFLTAVGFLRAPGDPLGDAAFTDLSVLVAVVFAAVGTWAYLRHERHGRSRTPGRGRAQSAAHGRPPGTSPDRALATSRDQGPATSDRRTLLGVRGWPRVSGAVICASAFGIVLVVLAATSVSGWGLSPRLFLTQTVVFPQFILVPVAVALGVVVGQTRWRTGVTVWELLSTRGFLDLLARPAVLVLACLLIPLTVVIVVGLAVSWLPAASHGVASAVLLRDTARVLFPVLLCVLVDAAAGIVGVLLGHYGRAMWLAPAAGLLALAVWVSVPPLADDQPDAAFTHGDGGQSESVTADSTADLICQDIDAHSVSPAQLCTAPVNAPYLAGGTQALGKVYAQVPMPDLLPSRVLLVDNAFDALPVPAAAIGLSGQRSLFSPSTMDAFAARQELAQTVSDSCPGLDDAALQAGLDPGDDRVPAEAITSTWQSTQECLS